MSRSRAHYAQGFALANRLLPRREERVCKVICKQWSAVTGNETYSYEKDKKE